MQYAVAINLLHLIPRATTLGARGQKSRANILKDKLRSSQARRYDLSKPPNRSVVSTLSLMGSGFSNGTNKASSANTLPDWD